MVARRDGARRRRQAAVPPPDRLRRVPRQAGRSPRVSPERARDRDQVARRRRRRDDVREPLAWGRRDPGRGARLPERSDALVDGPRTVGSIEVDVRVADRDARVHRGGHLQRDEHVPRGRRRHDPPDPRSAHDRREEDPRRPGSPRGQGRARDRGVSRRQDQAEPHRGERRSPEISRRPPSVIRAPVSRASSRSSTASGRRDARADRRARCPPPRHAPERRRGARSVAISARRGCAR